ncbi:conserved putative C-terminal domain protein [Tokyovirus A1]|uniref:conserved putative C-terminal domain protein n=1 Tax=Tokyovirus A1 TaxID=1826170 RepID=UPI0007A96A1D|nr:conserved putative C-terminal domain protein [Tokyovirus A1]BAU80139.1 conserved putative C-terminal domain protein [Tokyovirus A1]
MSEETQTPEKKYSVIVNLLPRTTPLVSKKPDFGDLGDLHLDMIEVKEKLRPGLPLVPPKRKEEPKKEEEEKKEEILAPPEPEKQTQEEPPVEQPGLVFEEEDDDPSPASDSEEEPDAPQTNAQRPPPVVVPPVVLPQENQDDDDSETSSEDEPEQQDPEEILTEEQKEEKERDELLWKFKILKKKHPQHLDTIPDFDEHSDIVTMRRKYQMTVKELHMESKLFEYRKFVFFGGCLFEGLCTNLLGVDVKGFSEVQDIHGYDALLVELGEKSYTNFTSYLPVELRLLIAFAMNVAIFYIFKTMSIRVTSEDVFNMISQVGGQKVADFLRQATGKEQKKETESAPTTKRRMRGPTIKAEDVRKMSIGKED